MSLVKPSSQNPVLVIEDDLTLLEAARIKLEKAGIPALTARDAKEALRYLKETKPALIWLDLLLPEMNGLEFLRRIREDPATKDLPVVVVSVSGSSEKVRQAFALNALDYITKSEAPIENIVKKIVAFTRKNR